MSITLETGTCGPGRKSSTCCGRKGTASPSRASRLSMRSSPTPGGFTADGLYDQLRGVAGIGRATVFRTVDTLAGLGYLRRLHSEEQCSQYIRTTPGHHHHLICTHCHRVVEFDGCTVDAIANELSERTHFRIQGHWLELFGLCPDCQAAA